MKDTLDLCVSCKGCKRDCPTGVDMAKFKIEARAAWAKRHGIALREKLVAFMPRYAPYAAACRRLDGRSPNACRWCRAWMKRAMGFAPERSLPRFREVVPVRRGDAQSERTRRAKEVLLFVDTFNNHMEPDNARDAQRVLEAAGYTVHFNTREGERPVCCGRTFLAAGLVDEAKREARRLLDTLMPFVERGVAGGRAGAFVPAVVARRVPAIRLRRGSAQAVGVGVPVRGVSRARESGGAPESAVASRSAHPARWVHGHCHQKAFDAFRPVQTVLGWIPELEVKTIESSCCGMAGSFGYEAEHYEASKAMAELSLLPAVRQAAQGDVIVADGTSCRHQIRDGAAAEALHVARVLALALDPGSSS